MKNKWEYLFYKEPPIWFYFYLNSIFSINNLSERRKSISMPRHYPCLLCYYNLIYYMYNDNQLYFFFFFFLNDNQLDPNTSIHFHMLLKSIQLTVRMEKKHLHCLNDRFNNVASLILHSDYCSQTFILKS